MRSGACGLFGDWPYAEEEVMPDLRTAIAAILWSMPLNIQ
jgi:hypothetical protein